MNDSVSDILQKKLNLNFTEYTEKIINNKSTFENYKKGTVLCRQGEHLNYLFFIIKGIVRGYYIDKEGNDITKCFSYENYFFASEGLRKGEDATFNLECLEDCICIKSPYEIIWSAAKEDNGV